MKSMKWLNEFAYALVALLLMIGWADKIHAAPPTIPVTGWYCNPGNCSNFLFLQAGSTGHVGWVFQPGYVPPPPPPVPPVNPPVGNPPPPPGGGGEGGPPKPPKPATPPQSQQSQAVSHHRGGHAHALRNAAFNWSAGTVGAVMFVLIICTNERHKNPEGFLVRYVCGKGDGTIYVLGPDSPTPWNTNAP